MAIDKELIKDDLYQAVNGEWLETAVIPDDKSSTGGFMNLRDGVEELLMADLDKMVAGEIELTNDEQVEMLKYYKQAMDFDKRNALEAKPVQPLLEKLKALETIQDLQTLASERSEKRRVGTSERTVR